MTKVNHPCRKHTSGPFEWCVHEACRPEGRISEEIKRMAKCAARLSDSRTGVTYHCERDATHYDVDIPPDASGPLYARDPGGWHKSGDQTWADHADGATPHGDKTAAPADVLPTYKASIRFGPQSGPNLDWESPYEISVTGPAAFVAHVVTSAADAFEEDAQR